MAKGSRYDKNAADYAVNFIECLALRNAVVSERTQPMKGKRSNGEGLMRQRPDGRWEFRLMIGRGNDGRPQYKSFYARTQRELKFKVQEWKDDISHGINWEADYTFEEWADIWYESHKDNIAPTTQDSYRYTLRVLKEYFGMRKLDTLKAFDIEEFLKKLRREGASKSRLSQCRGMLFQIFHKAEANDLAHKNPVRFADKMRNLDPGIEKEAFSAEEVKLLMFEYFIKGLDQAA